EADSDRYRKAAISRATDVSAAQQLYVWPEGLRSAADILRTLSAADDCARVARILLDTPLPVHVIGIFGDEPRVVPDRPSRSEPMRAMLWLDIDGVPIDSPMLVRANRAYRIGIRVLMEQWPTNAKAIEVDFLT